MISLQLPLNAGIFLFRANDMINAFKKIASETLLLASML